MLDFNEFLEIMTAKMSEKDSKEQIQKAFLLFKGPSGKISFDDLKAVAKELGETMSDEELMEMIKEDGDQVQRPYICIIWQWMAETYGKFLLLLAVVVVVVDQRNL